MKNRLAPWGAMIMALAMALMFLQPAQAHQSLRRVDHLFGVESFERDGDGFEIVIANRSKRGFENFKVIVLGKDMHYVTVYRQEIEVEGFMEGQSQRHFFLPGYDDRVFRVEIEVYDKTAPIDGGGE